MRDMSRTLPHSTVQGRVRHAQKEMWTFCKATYLFEARCAVEKLLDELYGDVLKYIRRRGKHPFSPKNGENLVNVIQKVR